MSSRKMKSAKHTIIMNMSQQLRPQIACAKYLLLRDEIRHKNEKLREMIDIINCAVVSISAECAKARLSKERLESFEKERQRINDLHNKSSVHFQELQLQLMERQAEAQQELQEIQQVYHELVDNQQHNETLRQSAHMLNQVMLHHKQ